MAATTIPVDEEVAVREKVRSIRLPPGIRLIRVEPDEEQTGEPAWRISFSVSRKLKLNKRTFSQLQEIRRSVKDAVLPVSPAKWVFVRFTEGK